MKLLIINGENDNEKIEININEYLMVADIKYKLDEILNVNRSCTNYYYKLIHKNIILQQFKSIKYYKISENDEIWFGFVENYLKNDNIIVDAFHIGGIIIGGEYLIINPNETISTIKSVIEKVHSKIIDIWNANGMQMKNDQTIREITSNANYKLIIRCDDENGNEINNTFDECCCLHDKLWTNSYFGFDELLDENKDESIREILIDGINQMKQIFSSTDSDDERLKDNLSEYPSSFVNSKNLFSEDMTYSIVDILNDYSFSGIFQDEEIEGIFSKYIQSSLRSALWNYCNLRQCNPGQTNKSINEIIIDAFDIYLNYLNDSNNDWNYWLRLWSNQHLLKSSEDSNVVEKMDDSSSNNFTFEIKMYGKNRLVTLESKPETVIEAKKIISNAFNVEMKHLYCIKPGGDHKPNDDDIFENGFIIEVVLGMGDIEIKKSLGQGGYGEFFLCLDKTSKQEFVLKRGYKNKYLSRDINIYSKLHSSKLIMSYSGLFRDEDGLGIAMQHMPGGSLCGYLNKLNHITEEEIVKFSLQILLQIHELHEAGIIHRDIKSDNIVIDDEGNAKLIDFGLSKFLDGLSSKELVERLKVYLPGTIYYMAPELIKEEPYSNKIDIWSFGMVMVEMITKERPFPGLNTYKTGDELLKLKEYIFTPVVPISNGFQQFINSCLLINPEERPNAKQLIDSEFCNNYLNVINK